jgi:hypothetical protein
MYFQGGMYIHHVRDYADVLTRHPGGRIRYVCTYCNVHCLRGPSSAWLCGYAASGTVDCAELPLHG